MISREDEIVCVGFFPTRIIHGVRLGIGGLCIYNISEILGIIVKIQAT